MTVLAVCAALLGGCGDAGPVRVALTAAGDRFSPTVLRVPAGGEVRIDYRNSDLYPHTFTVAALDLHRYLPADASGSFKLPDLAAGSYRLVCQVTGHDKMRGTLIVG